MCSGPGARWNLRQISRGRFHLVDLQAAGAIIGECFRVIQAAGIDPDSRSIQFPGNFNCPDQEVTAQANKLRQKAKVGNLDIAARLSFEPKVARRVAGQIGHPGL